MAYAPTGANGIYIRLTLIGLLPGFECIKFLFVCFKFARCLCEGLDINGSYDVDMERERITSVIFCSCHDDLDW